MRIVRDLPLKRLPVTFHCLRRARNDAGTPLSTHKLLILGILLRFIAFYHNISLNCGNADTKI
jgi:hypothetical protein